jgi:MFS family permease
MAAFGPLLGGWLTSSFSWQRVLMVNLPFGLLVLVGIVLNVPESKATVHARGIDVDGLLLPVPSLLGWYLHSCSDHERNH